MSLMMRWTRTFAAASAFLGFVFVTPSWSQPTGPGVASKALIACFLDLETKTRSHISNGLEQSPTPEFDTEVLALHKKATDRIVDLFERFVADLLENNNSEDLEHLNIVEEAIVQSFLLDECALMSNYMSTTISDADVRRTKRAYEAVDSIKRALLNLIPKERFPKAYKLAELLLKTVNELMKIAKPV